MERGLFAGGVVGEHRVPELKSLGIFHLGGVVAEGEGGSAALPLRSALTVWVAGFGKLGEIIGHFVSESVVLLGEGAPAVVECAEPIPQIRGVPRAVIVSGEISLKEPEVGVGLLRGAPFLRHREDEGWEHILTR